MFFDEILSIIYNFESIIDVLYSFHDELLSFF